jgi:methyl-accepting chemotaxis protein
VRKLAERSGTAARDITRLIDQSVGRIATGTELSHEAAGAFSGIADAVKQTGEAIENIAGSVRSQEEVSLQVVGLIERLALASNKRTGTADH